MQWFYVSYVSNINKSGADRKMCFMLMLIPVSFDSEPVLGKNLFIWDTGHMA